MANIGVGDLAQSLVFQRENARLTTELTRLTEELSSGRKSVTAYTDRTAISSLERDLSTMEAERRTADEAELIASTSQLVLGQIADSAQTASDALLLTIGAPQPTSVQSAGADAATAFEVAVSSLNTQVAGRSLFSGRAFDQPALIDASLILDELALAAAGETTAAGVEAIVDAYFAPGGGYETTAHQGSTTAADPIRLGAELAVEPTLQATDERLTEMLAALAKGALLDRNILVADAGARAELAEISGQEIISANEALIAARADLGSAEEKIETASVRLDAQISASELALSELISADPYETAARIDEIEIQLQSLYTIVGRLSNLTLTNFLR